MLPHSNPAVGELLTLPEAAGILKLKVSTLRAWILRRKVPYIKLGRSIRLRRSDIDALIEDALVPARPIIADPAAMNFMAAPRLQ